MVLSIQLKLDILFNIHFVACSVLALSSWAEACVHFPHLVWLAQEGIYTFLIKSVKAIYTASRSVQLIELSI